MDLDRGRHSRPLNGPRPLAFNLGLKWPQNGELTEVLGWGRIPSCLHSSGVIGGTLSTLGKHIGPSDQGFSACHF